MPAAEQQPRQQRRPGRAALPLLLLPLLAPALAACQADRGGAAVQLILSADPDLGDPADLVRQVAAMVVIVRAVGGLRGVDRAGPLPGGGTALDVDGDGVLEAVFSVSPLSGLALPILELSVEHNAGRELSFEVRGFAAPVSTTPLDPNAEPAIALGAATATCPPGQVMRIGIPFNLRAAARPPQVTLVLPPDGAKGVTPVVGKVLVMFSTTIDEATVAGQVSLGGVDDAPLPVTTSVETLAYASPGAGAAGEQRSLLSVIIGDVLLAEGAHVLRVGPGITSTAGRPFDQDPATPAPDPFVARFDVANLPGTVSTCQCPPHYQCDGVGRGCIPILDCAAGCLTGFVCHPAGNVCVDDCRTYGACASASARCDPSSGLCVAATGADAGR